jgi:hypothetical protein
VLSPAESLVEAGHARADARTAESPAADHPPLAVLSVFLAGFVRIAGLLGGDCRFRSARTGTVTPDAVSGQSSPHAGPRVRSPINSSEVDSVPRSGRRLHAEEVTANTRAWDSEATLEE